MTRSIFLALVTVGMVTTGCTSSGGTSTAGAGGSVGEGGSAAQGGPSSGTGKSTGNGGAAGTGGGSASSSMAGSGGAGAGSLNGSVDTDLTMSGDVMLNSTTLIKAGVTLTFEPGSTIHGASGASILVDGTLAVPGTAGAPVVFMSQADNGPDGWGGVTVQAGGTAAIAHAEIREATMGFTALASSHYDLSYLQIDTSGQLMLLQSDGTVSHSTLHAFGAKSQGGPILIESASPAFSDTLIDNATANPPIDHVTVAGQTSAPSFDHMDISQCHCAFHFAAGMGITVSNSYIHDSAYGAMVEQSIDTKVTDSNFEGNTVNFGDCNIAALITLQGDFIQGKAFDTSCMGQTNKTPVNQPIAGVGPRP